MAYVPDPLNPALPTAANFVSSLTAELRALKTQLVTNRADIDSNDVDIAQNVSDIADVVSLVSVGRFALLTGVGSFEVPIGISSLLVIAIGGGEGGQGGHARIRVSIEGNLTSYATPAFCGKAGAPGNIVSGVFAVTPEESISYTCGGGGAGGAANNSDVTSTIDIDQGKPNGLISPFYHGNSPTFNFLYRSPADFASKRQPPGVLVQMPVRLQIGDTPGNPAIPQLMIGKEETGVLGSAGSDGGDTTFGVLITATGGQDNRYDLGNASNLYPLFGSLGKGGNGGNSRHGEVSPVAGTAGGTGGAGAILVIW